MKYSLLVMLLVSSVVAAPPPPTHEELLSRVQAADMFGDLLTANGQRVAAKVDSLRGFLKESGRLDAFEHANQPATLPSHDELFYSDLFDAAVKFIRGGGDKYADPALKNLNDVQLTKELAALSDFDLQQFAFMRQKRDELTGLRTFVATSGATADLEKWAKEKAPDLIQPAGTTRPSALTADEALARAVKLLDADKSAAWERAKAKGTSQADFDQQWSQKQMTLKQDEMQRIQGMSALAWSLDQPAPQPVISGPQPLPSGPAYVPFGWGVTFNNPYNSIYTGPGIYNTYDRRLNDDYDQRVNGEYDRRNALGFDRRENIHIDVRHGD